MIWFPKIHREMRMCLAATLVLLLAAVARAGEFPADWYFPAGEVRATHAAMEGKPAPALTVAHWLNGEVKPESLKGQVVVIDLWATWCGPCLQGIPENNALYAKYREKGMLFLGICCAEGQEKLPEVVKARGIKYPVARDPEGKTAAAWKVGFFPTYGVIDRKGTLRALGLRPDKVEAVVEKLLQEPGDKAVGK